MDDKGRRSKRVDYCDIFSTVARSIYYPHSPNESPSLGETSAIRKQKKNVVGQLRKNSSSSTNANHSSNVAYGPHDCERSKSTNINQYKSTTCVGCKNAHEDEYVDNKKNEIEIINKAEFRNKRTHFVSGAVPSAKQDLYGGYSTSTSGKYFDGVSDKISNVNLSNSLLPDNVGRPGCGDEYMDPEEIEIEIIDEVEFGNKRTHSMLKTRESINRRPDKSNSFVEKGNDSEDMDPDNIEIERIDEAEFRNKKTHFVLKIIGPSTKQELSKGDSAVTFRMNSNGLSKNILPHARCRSSYANGHPDKSSSFVEKEIVNQDAEVDFEKIDENRKKSTGSSYLKMKKINEEWDILDDYANSDSVESDSSLQSNRIFVKRFPELNNASLDILAESNDEDSEENNSSFSEKWDSPCSYSEKFDAQNYKSLKALAVKNESCSKQKETAGKHALKRGCLSNLHKKQEKCNRHASRSHEFFFRKRKLSSDASGKRNKGGIIYKANDGPGENEGINKGLGDDAYEKEVLKKRRAGRKEDLPKCPNSELLNTQKDCNAAGINEFHSKDHLKDDDVQSGYNNETKCSTKRKQVPSKQHDFCRMLADSVLERGQFPEEKESNEAAKQAAAPQVQNNLPLKFRFEDETPKPVEKTEHEKEMEGLFAELDFCRALGELGSFNFPEVDNENSSALAEDTQFARCTRGKHELVLQDDIGLRCIYCPHVELGPKDVMPMWAEKTCKQSEKTRSSKRQLCPEFDTRSSKRQQCPELDTRSSKRQQFPEFDKLHLESSMDNSSDLGNDFSNDGDETVWNFKPGIRESLYKHQQEGFEFLWKNLAGSINLAELKSSDPSGVGGCIISHAPGTGKTRLTIVFLETYLKLFPNCRPMIIAPASMLLTWEEEFRKWNVEFPFHNLNSLEFFGKENKTALQLLARARRKYKEVSRMVKVCSWNAGRSILGISYSLYEKLTGEKCIEGKRSKKRKRVTGDTKSEALGKKLLEKPELVILDEGHTPRNERSNIWNALLKLQTGKRVILSGTPFQNNFAELFNTFRLVRPAFANVLAQEKIFSAEMITSRKMNSLRKYEGKNAKSASNSKVVDSAVEKLKIAMSPFVHVHKGTILQQSLPGLRDCVVLLKPPALQKSLIERIEGFQSTFEFEHKVALISVHPYLLQFCGSTENQWLGIDMGSAAASKLNPNEGAKTKFIFELVRLSLAMNEKVLIFSQYIQPLELIKEQLKEIFKWVDGRQIFQMWGKLGQKQRQNMINIFNDPQSEAKVMLASMKCCSEGISLVGASRLVLLDVVWNPSVERQAISRAYRIGQKKFVYTYHLMTSGTTEGDKYCRQAEKKRLSELVFTSSSNESNKHKNPAASIEDMILEGMVDHAKLSEMFEKIINQPKDTDLVQTFGLTS